MCGRVVMSFTGRWIVASDRDLNSHGHVERVRKRPDMSANVTGKVTNAQNEAKPNRPLTNAQQVAARCLAFGFKPSRVARRLEISGRTLRRWRQLPAFVAETTRCLDRLALLRIPESWSPPTGRQFLFEGVQYGN